MGFCGGILYKLYCCYVRSVIEYCSPVYHSLLNAGQELQLERLQRHAVRVCYGCDEDVGLIMARENIETLKARRIRRCGAFIRKAAANPRFSPRCFPPREGEERALRLRRLIQETRAATQRRYNSPLLYMRRRANELGVAPLVQARV